MLIEFIRAALGYGKPVPVSDTSPLPVATVPATMTYVGKEQITDVSSGDTALTVPPGARVAWVKPRDVGVYVSLSGDTADSSDFEVDAGALLQVSSALADVRMLQVASSAVVDVWYFA